MHFYKHATKTPKQINLTRLKRVFWRVQGLWLKPGAVGMQVAFGRVRRKTVPTVPGTTMVICSKITQVATYA